MATRVRLGLVAAEAGRAGIAAALCVLMAGQPVLAEGAPADGPRAVRSAVPGTATERTVAGGPLQGQARVLHALNRFTFGPRPGEVAAVERMGLDRWFERQLNPGAIDDAALEARLERYPAMLLPATELEARYPGPGEIRQMDNGSLPLPSDPAARAIAEDQIAFYRLKRAAMDKGQAAGAADGTAGQGIAGAANGTADASDTGRGRKRRIKAGMNALDDEGALMSDGTRASEKPLAASDLSPDGATGQAEMDPSGLNPGSQTGRAAGPRPGNQAGSAAESPTGSPTGSQTGSPMSGQTGGQTGSQTGGQERSSMGTTPGAAAVATNGKGKAALRKAGGFDRDRAEAILAEPAAERYQTVMAMPAPELVRFRGSLNPRDVAALVDGMTPTQRETLVALPGSLRMIGAEETQVRVLRDVYSDRELEAVMTDFWLNHFNVYIRKNQQEPYLIPAYERETIRPRALGKFEDLLVATAESPAMEVYLDNYKSIGPDSRAAARAKDLPATRPNGKPNKQVSAGLNENYGRELMELHTLGVSGGYTQADVTNVAKVFTGWGLANKRQMAGGGAEMALGGGGAFGRRFGAGAPAGVYQKAGFEFNPNRHEPGSKLVLGQTIAEGGMNEGLEVLHMLATSPATAHFICGKLAVRFVSDTPPQALVDRMSATFLSSGGDIKAVLRTMWRSPEFWSPEVERSKLKTPEEFVISAARASGLEVKEPLGLVQSIDKLGQPLYGMQTPNGYSWMKDGWVGTGALVSRLNFSLVMSDDRLPGTRTEWEALLGESAGGAGLKPAAYVGAETAEAKERRLEAILLGMPVSERTRATVLSQAASEDIAAQAETQFDLGGGGAGKGAKGARYAQRVLAHADDGLDRGPDDPQAAVIAGLLLGSPEFQRR